LADWGKDVTARSIRETWFSASLRAAQKKGMARFSVTAVTAVTGGEARRKQGEGSTRRCCVRKLGNPDFVTEVMLVGWETRERGGKYYTRSKWVNGGVVREYVGSGRFGQLVARWDELERLRKKEEAARWRKERERLERSAGFLRELEEAAEILIRAELLVAGFHKRKGEWRRLRELRERS
jgi:hypothetical protein